MNTSTAIFAKSLIGVVHRYEKDQEEERRRESGSAGEMEEDGARIGVHDFSVLPIDTIGDLRGGLH